MLFSRGAAMLLLGCAAGFLCAQSGQTARDKLTGAWKLVELDQPAPEGGVRKQQCSGLFAFTEDGHVSVQVMEKEPQRASAGSVEYAQGGYEASYGTYAVNAGAHTFTIHVEGALVRSLIGKNLVRRYEISGRRMTVESARPEEHWRAVWERY